MSDADRRYERGKLILSNKIKKIIAKYDGRTFFDGHVKHKILENFDLINKIADSYLNLIEFDENFDLGLSQYIEFLTNKSNSIRSIFETLGDNHV